MYIFKLCILQISRYGDDGGSCGECRTHVYVLCVVVVVVVVVVLLCGDVVYVCT